MRGRRRHVRAQQQVLVYVEKCLLQLYDLRLQLYVRRSCLKSVLEDMREKKSILSPRAKGSPSLRYPRSYSART